MLGDQFKRIFLGKTITPLTMFKWAPNFGTNFLVVHIRVDLQGESPGESLPKLTMQKIG